MTVKVLSKEWVEAVCKAINNNPNYKPSALTWEGDVLLVFEPSGNLDHEVRVFLGLYHGECTGTRLIPEGEEVETEFIMSGLYLNFVSVVKKEIDPIRALMSGKLKLEGDMAKLMRNAKAALEMVNSFANVDTDYI
ncbi:MAG: SCP2 sterol-binding domain-containing protein [Promethearchaeota archaeon]